jgi:hypothetical protein
MNFVISDLILRVLLIGKNHAMSPGLQTVNDFIPMWYPTEAVGGNILTAVGNKIYVFWLQRRVIV